MISGPRQREAARPALDGQVLVLDCIYLISLPGFVKGITTGEAGWLRRRRRLTLWGPARARIGRPGMSSNFRTRKTGQSPCSRGALRASVIEGRKGRRGAPGTSFAGGWIPRPAWSGTVSGRLPSRAPPSDHQTRRQPVAEPATPCSRLAAEVPAISRLAAAHHRPGGASPQRGTALRRRSDRGPRDHGQDGLPRGPQRREGMPGRIVRPLPVACH